MSVPGIHLDVSGAIAELVLDRPERRNAMSEAMWTALPGLVEQAAAEPGLRALIVRGAGEHFCAGADISEFGEVYATPERAEAFSRAVDGATAALAACPVPTVAMIRGACVGGGCALALACDLRFAAETARLGVTPARLGLVYPLEDTRRLVEAAGRAAAKDLLFSGRLIEAREAERIGLADRVFPADALEGETRRWTEALSAVSGRTARDMKTMIALLDAPREDAAEQGRRLFLDAFESADFAEGYRAFLDKRPPRFA